MIARSRCSCVATHSSLVRPLAAAAAASVSRFTATPAHEGEQGEVDVERDGGGQPGVREGRQHPLGVREPARDGLRAGERQRGRQPRVPPERRPQRARRHLQARPPAGRRLGGQPRLAQRGVHHPEQQVVLVRDVPVERHRAGPELRGHPSHRQRVEPLGVGDHHGRPDDAADARSAPLARAARRGTPAAARAASPAAPGLRHRAARHRGAPGRRSRPSCRPRPPADRPRRATGGRRSGGGPPRPGRGPAAGRETRAAPRARGGPGPRSGGANTTVPTPGTARTRPSSRSAASTRDAVAIATPQRRVISRADGTRSPGASSPRSICARSSAAIRTEGGSVTPTSGLLVARSATLRGSARAPPRSAARSRTSTRRQPFRLAEPRVQSYAARHAMNTSPHLRRGHRGTGPRVLAQREPGTTSPSSSGPTRCAPAARPWTCAGRAAPSSSGWA